MKLMTSRIAAGLIAFGLLAAGSLVVAQEAATETAAIPTPEQVLAGKRVWVDAACFNCHGTNGQGGSSKDFPKGPSLRKSVTDDETITEIIACGLPGTLMPGWAKGAYTERPCFGETGEIPDGTRLVGAYDEQQLNDLMAYINVTFRKRGQ